MKMCRFEHENTIKFGVLKNDSVFPINDSPGLEQPSDSVTLTESIKLTKVRPLPFVIPSKIVCIGRNYAEHAKELGNKVPTEPLIFLKAPSSLIIEGEEIVLPEQSMQVEHEGELALIIGRACTKLTKADNPLEYVFGYACLNDVTARDLQRKDVQFTRAKSFDTFCPLSSFVETELDVSNLRVTTRVNGVVKQDGQTSQMIFPVDFLIRYVSNIMTLNAGDVIATGTPAGVSKLSEGDLCEVEIEGIGVLHNRVK